MSPHGYLGTDTGGKVATLEVMAHHGGGLDPTSATGPHGGIPRPTSTGSTTRPARRPVSERHVAADDLRGAAALRAGRLPPGAPAAHGRRRGRAPSRPGAGAAPGPRDGWVAFWVVGLASPVTIYALDLWEHSLGLALMAWGVVALLDAWAAPDVVARSAGRLAFGAAASMRTEAFVYGFVATAAICCCCCGATDRCRAARGGRHRAAGFAAMLGANEPLEIGVLGTTMRAARASDGAASGGSDLVGTAAGGRDHVRQPAGLDGVGQRDGGRPARRAAVPHRLTGPRGVGEQRSAKLAAAVVVVVFLLRLAEGSASCPAWWPRRRSPRPASCWPGRRRSAPAGRHRPGRRCRWSGHRLHRRRPAAVGRPLHPDQRAAARRRRHRASEHALAGPASCSSTLAVASPCWA